MPLEQLALSPQCGFASTGEGNLVTDEDQWSKLALVKEIAEEVKKQMDLTIDKKKVQLKEAIRTLGTHMVPVKLHPKVTAELKVVVKEEA